MVRSKKGWVDQHFHNEIRAFSFRVFCCSDRLTGLLVRFPIRLLVLLTAIEHLLTLSTAHQALLLRADHAHIARQHAQSVPLAKHTRHILHRIMLALGLAARRNDNDIHRRVAVEQTRRGVDRALGGWLVAFYACAAALEVAFVLVRGDHWSHGGTEEGDVCLGCRWSEQFDGHWV